MKYIFVNEKTNKIIAEVELSNAYEALGYCKAIQKKFKSKHIYAYIRCGMQ